MADDIMQTISRVRRAMPRNTDVMTICDALETEIVSEGLARQAEKEMVKTRLTRAEIQKNYRLRKKGQK